MVAPFLTVVPIQRQHRVGQDAGVQQIGAGEAQVAGADLEGGVVPQRDGDRLVRRQAVIQANACRDLLGAGPAGARSGARSLLQAVSRALGVYVSSRCAGGADAEHETGDESAGSTKHSANQSIPLCGVATVRLPLSPTTAPQA